MKSLLGKYNPGLLTCNNSPAKLLPFIQQVLHLLCRHTKPAQKNISPRFVLPVLDGYVDGDGAVLVAGEHGPPASLDGFDIV